MKFENPWHSVPFAYSQMTSFKRSQSTSFLVTCPCTYSSLSNVGVTWKCMPVYQRVDSALRRACRFYLIPECVSKYIATDAYFAERWKWNLRKNGWSPPGDLVSEKVNTHSHQQRLSHILSEEKTHLACSLFCTKEPARQSGYDFINDEFLGGKENLLKLAVCT